MRNGEKGIIVAMILSVVGLAVYKTVKHSADVGPDPGIPFYSTADPALITRAAKIMHANECKLCHRLWGTRDLMQSVPAPPLDGIGTLKTEAWLYDYFSAENPQSILPSRLKPQYRMPSLAKLTEAERRDLAAYMASLKVEDWYLEETKKAEHDALFGKTASAK